MAKQKRPVIANDHVAAIARRPSIDYKKWQTFWDENADLKSKRKHPNILFHGVKDPQNPPAWKHPPDEYEYEDDPTQRTENAPVDSHTSFSAALTKTYLRLRVVDQDYALFPDARYELSIGGIEIDPVSLTPDGSGVLTVEYPDSVIPAAVGLLKVFYKPPAPVTNPPTPAPAEICIQFTLSLGRLDPINDTTPAGDNYMSGVQQRLNNLGLNAGEVDGIGGPITESAIRRFQKLCKIDPPEEALGKPTAGAQTLDWLEKLHDKPGKPPDGSTPSRPTASTTSVLPVSDVPVMGVVGTSVPTTTPGVTPLEQAQQRLTAAMLTYDAAKQSKAEAYRKRDSDIGAYTRANQAFMSAEKEVKEARRAVQSLGGTVKV